MAWGIVAVGAGSLILGKMQSDDQSDAAREAAGIQAGAARAGIEEQRKMFTQIQELLSPYIESGKKAQESQLALMGLAGPEAQQAAMEEIQKGPAFTALAAQGEGALLQQASATGGLRGGNIQGALGQFRPKLLSDLIQQRFQNLQSITQTGVTGATGVAGFGSTSSMNVANLLAQQGAAQAGGVLGQGSGWTGAASDTLGLLAGAGMQGKGPFASIF